MKRILLGMLAVVVLLAVVVTARTLQFRSRQVPVQPVADIAMDADAAARRLAGALRFRTISYQDSTQFDAAERTVTLKGPRGNVVTLPVSEKAKNFDKVKVGDTELTWRALDTSSRVSTACGAPVDEISSLTVTLSYGGQRKILSFQPLGEDTTGQFMAPILPTVPGEYEVILGGILDDMAVEAENHVEEVQPIDVLAFPAVDSTRQSAAADWLFWLSILIGLIGTGLGVTALRKASTR